MAGRRSVLEPSRSVTVGRAEASLEISPTTEPLAFDRSDSVTFGGAIGGTGALGQLGSGTLTLTGNSTYSCGTTINAGTLQIGNGGTSGSISGNITDNGNLAFDRSESVTLGGAISGTGALVQLGSSTLTLTGSNTYSGGTTISACILQIRKGATCGSIP